MAAEKLTIHLSDEAQLKMLRLILTYEANVRGRTIGQTATDLVQEAIDLDAYPEEVRARLAEIADQSTRRAIQKSLEACGWNE